MGKDGTLVYTHRCPRKDGRPIFTPAHCWAKANPNEHPDCEGCQWTQKPVKPEIRRIPCKK